jgi:hypothetical protein
VADCPWCHDSPARPVFARWELNVAMPWPSAQNGRGGSKRLANGGAGRWEYKRIRTGWERAISRATYLHEVERAARPRRLTLVRLWGKGQRACDRDNLVTGGKPIRDAAATAGLIIGDGPGEAIIHYQQRKADDGVPAVLIIVEEFA